MHILMSGILFVTAATAEPTPAAMVLRVEGAATVLPAGGKARRAAAVMDLLYPEDRIDAEAGSDVVLVFLSDGHRERLKPSCQATVSSGGCMPDRVVERRRPVTKIVVAGGVDLRPLARGGRGAAVVFR